MPEMTLDYGAELLAEFLGEAWDRHRARVMLDHYDACLLALEYETRKDERSFYENSALYLLEGIHWNSSEVFKIRQGELARLHGLRVLDFGGGVGTVSHQLALQGNEVVYCDINRVCRAFAEWWGRKIRSGVLAYEEDVLLTAKWGLFDVVIALDVMEHVEHLPQLLTDISRLMKPDAMLYAKPAWGAQEIYPMHHDFSADYQRWLAETGFEPKSEGWTRRLHEVTA